jgi:hypothetical protein
VILKNSDELIKIQVIEASTFNIVFEHQLTGDYVKAAAIHQNFDGRVFCVPYLKDGQFCMITFNYRKVLDEVCLSTLLDM